MSQALVNSKFNFGGHIFGCVCLFQDEMRRACLKQEIELLFIQRHWGSHVQAGVRFKVLISNFGSPCSIASNSEVTSIGFVVVY